MKRTVGFVLSAGVCGFALWKGMQAVAIVALMAALAIVFMHSGRRAFEAALDLFGGINRARLGKLELVISRQLESMSDRIVQRAAWAQIVLSQLRSEDVGLLLAISTVRRYPATEALKHQLRSLRARGLILHDKATLAESSEVWLSELGQEVASLLREAENMDTSHTEAAQDEAISS